MWLGLNTRLTPKLPKEGGVRKQVREARVRNLLEKS